MDSKMRPTAAEGLVELDVGGDPIGRGGDFQLLQIEQRALGFEETSRST